VGALLDSGVERVSLALDAACERVYEQAKDGNWQRQVELLSAAARRFPGRIGTHLIAGLGETEQEMCTILQAMLDQGITVGLFSFTPVRGTRWSGRQPPALASYRRIQAALYVLAGGASRVDGCHFSATGQIVSYGLSQQRLREVLADGRAFQTAGCPGCNRPYYNERPGKLLYNYPRPLRGQEVEAAVSLVQAELADE
jgi:biotin synthase